MQWLDFLRDACVTAGAALADVTADALHGTSAVCAMTIRHVHQTLDDKRAAQAKEVKKQGKSLERQIFKYARGGPGDREHYPKLVKHMNSGKKSNGTSTIGR